MNFGLVNNCELKRSCSYTVKATKERVCMKIASSLVYDYTDKTSTVLRPFTQSQQNYDFLSSMVQSLGCSVHNVEEKLSSMGRYNH